MDVVSLLLIAVGLAADAFAVSISNGVTLKKLEPKEPLRFALFFGVFQFGMTYAGYLLGSAFAVYIVNIDHWVAFVMLLFIGIKALYSSFKDEENLGSPISDIKTMLMLSVATSIDALAVGVSFAMLEIDILFASMVIGVICAVLSATGVVVGKLVGAVLKKGAERIGAVILILIGCKILIEHLFFS